MIRSASASLLGLILASLSPVPAAHAQARSDFWESVENPEAPRARELVRQARTQLLMSRQFDATGPAQRRARVENALRRMEMAHEILPNDPEVIFWLATATSAWQRPNIHGQLERRDERAKQLWERLREIDPGYESEAVAFELGVLHTRSNNFDGAITEYQQAATLSLNPSNHATTLSNLAEVTMLAGQLENSVRIYEQAVRRAQQAGDTGDLALWGLAVALDRLGERSEALRRVDQALSAGGGTTAALEQDGVFFEPANEVHWYYALASLARARSATPDERDIELSSARRRFQRFIAEASGADAPWVQQARDHVERIDAELRD